MSLHWFWLRPTAAPLIICSPAVSLGAGSVRHDRLCRMRHNRHTFAARTIVHWYRKGMDPGREMIKLSTYLGHLKPEHTYWYLEAVPDIRCLPQLLLARLHV